MFDKRDKALIEASSLVGYCESFDVVAMQDLETRKRWEKGLREYANNTGNAIAACWSESITVPGGE